MSSDGGVRDWVFDSVLQFLGSPLWTHQVLSFIDEHCHVFDDGEEAQHEHNRIHQAFQELVEVLLEQHLAELGVTPEQFVAACERGAGNPANEAVLKHVLAVDDFLTFRSLMINRNIELNQEAIRLWQSKVREQEAAAAAAEAAAAAAAAGGGGGDDATGEGGEGDDDPDAEAAAREEEELLRRAIAESQIEYEKLQRGDMTEEQFEAALQASLRDIDARKAAEEKEQAELEMAIAMSLALDEERQRAARSAAEVKAEADAAEASSSSAAAAPAAAAAAAPAASAASSSSVASDASAADFRRETERKLAAERELRSRAAEDRVRSLEEDRVAKEAMLAKRSAEARRIMNELREARDESNRERARVGEEIVRAAPAAPAPVAAAPAAAGGVDAELRQRQEFLRRVRATLVAQKTKARETEVAAYREKVARDPEVARAAREAREAAAGAGGSSSGAGWWGGGGARAGSGPTAAEAAEEERMRMRIALGQRMKMEMVSGGQGGKKSEADHRREMDEQLKRVGEQRDAKKRAEEEAKLEAMRNEAERARALDKMHSNLKVVEADDDFDFKE
jgi:hypothetical protein